MLEASWSPYIGHISILSPRPPSFYQETDPSHSGVPLWLMRPKPCTVTTCHYHSQLLQSFTLNFPPHVLGSLSWGLGRCGNFATPTALHFGITGSRSHLSDQELRAAKGLHEFQPLENAWRFQTPRDLIMVSIRIVFHSWNKWQWWKSAWLLVIGHIRIDPHIGYIYI